MLGPCRRESLERPSVREDKGAGMEEEEEEEEAAEEEGDEAFPVRMR